MTPWVGKERESCALRELEWGSQQGSVVGGRMGVLSIHPGTHLGEAWWLCWFQPRECVRGCGCLRLSVTLSLTSRSCLAEHWLGWAKNMLGLLSRLISVGHYVSVLGRRFIT